jgi:hypothetical protein
MEKISNEIFAVNLDAVTKNSDAIKYVENFIPSAVLSNQTAVKYISN